MPSLLCVSVHRFKLGHAGVTKFTVENVMEASCYVHVLLENLLRQHLLHTSMSSMIVY